MTTATDNLINGAAAAQQTAVDATKAAAETAAKVTTRVTTRATRAAVDNATAAFDNAARAVKTAQANGADVTAAVTKAAHTTVEALTQAGDGVTPGAQAKVQELVDAFTASTKQGMLTWLDAYAKGFDAFLDLQTQLAQATKVEAVTELVSVNVGALAQLNTTYVDTVRDLLQ